MPKGSALLLQWGDLHRTRRFFFGEIISGIFSRSEHGNMAIKMLDLPTIHGDFPLKNGDLPTING